MPKLQKNRVIIWVVVIGLLFFLHYTSLLSPLENLLLRAFSPWSGQIYDKNFFDYDHPEQWSNLSQEELLSLAQHLKDDNDALLIGQAAKQELELENIQLRSFLNFFSDQENEMILANVIYRENMFGETEFDESIFIDRGSRDGLRAGLLVVSDSGAVVGKITEVKAEIAKVCLSINEDCKLAATLQNETRTIGITSGHLGLTMRMNFVSQLDQVNEGDLVVSSGLDAEIPRGFVIGKVSQVEKKSNEIWQDISVEPLVDFNDLNIVAIVLP